MMNFLKVFKGRNLSCLLLLTIILSGFPVKADYVTDSDGNGFTLSFSSSLEFKSQTFDSDFENWQPLNIKNLSYINLWNTGISADLSIFLDKQTHDLGFSLLKDQGKVTALSHFIITENKNNYIDYVEIDWSTGALERSYGGAICLYGKLDERLTVENDSTLYDAQCEYKQYLYPPDEGGIVKYTLQKPCRYVALVYSPTYTEDGLNRIARFSSFALHFTDTWNGPDIPTFVQLGDPDNSLLDIEWKNREDMVLEGIVANIEDLSDLDFDDIEFYIRPDFQPNVKPDVLDEKPDDFSQAAWFLYALFEENESSYSYDGYWPEGESEIICKYDENKNSLTIPAPCSGRYILGVRSTLEEIEANEMTLNVWPGIRNTYEYLAETYPEDDDDQIFYFSLNRINFRNDESGRGKDYQTFIYPYNQDNHDEPYSKEEITIFVPGLYDAQIYYKLELNNKNNIRSARVNESAEGDGLEGYTNIADTPLSFAEMNSAGGTLSLRLAKNGAITPSHTDLGSETKFLISLGDIPTTVVELEMSDEDSMPVYYNISGMKVNGDKLQPGIYIMKKGSQTEKIIINHNK